MEDRTPALGPRLSGPSTLMADYDVSLHRSDP
jgi:hypothetical protein